MNTNNKCRLCLNYSDLQIPLFGEYAIRNDILMKIKKCLPNKIVKNGNTISSICYKCLNSLEMTYVFWKQCHDTEVLINANNFIEQPTNRINIIDSDEDDDNFEFYSDPIVKTVQNSKITPTNIKPMEVCGSPPKSNDYWKHINDIADRKSFVKVIPAHQPHQSTPMTSILPNGHIDTSDPASYSRLIQCFGQAYAIREKTPPPPSISSSKQPQAHPALQSHQSTPITTLVPNGQIDTSEQASYSRLMQCFGQAYAIREKTPPPPSSISSSQQPQAHPEQSTMGLIDSSLLSLTPKKDLIEKFRSWKPPPTPQSGSK